MLSFSEKTGEESRPLICIKAQVVGRSFVLRFFWMVLIDQVQLLAFPYLEAKFVVHSMKRSTLRRKIETVGF